MRVETFTDRATYSEIVTAPGELVRIEEALVFLPQTEDLAQPRPWGRWFVLAGSFGAIGGLAAALLINNADAPRFRSLPPPVQTATVTLPPPLATTTVTVQAPPRRAIASEEMSRLKARNRRLEALVRVLRRRDSN